MPALPLELLRELPVVAPHDFATGAEVGHTRYLILVEVVGQQHRAPEHLGLTMTPFVGVRIWFAAPRSGAKTYACERLGSTDAANLSGCVDGGRGA